MKKLSIILSFVFIGFLVACGGDADKQTDSSNPPKSMVDQGTTAAGYDPERGEGKWTADNVNVGAKLDPAMAAEGKKIFDVKCASCHKTTDERLVGPGWKGVTSRQTAPWIMNFITNPDPMIDKDPELQAQLEICLVRMPNQSLTDDDARKLLEFMRQNDGVQ